MKRIPSLYSVSLSNHSCKAISNTLNALSHNLSVSMDTLMSNGVLFTHEEMFLLTNCHSKKDSVLRFTKRFPLELLELHGQRQKVTKSRMSTLYRSLITGATKEKIDRRIESLAKELSFDLIRRSIKQSQGIGMMVLNGEVAILSSLPHLEAIDTDAESDKRRKAAKALSLDIALFESECIAIASQRMSLL